VKKFLWVVGCVVLAAGVYFFFGRTGAAGIGLIFISAVMGLSYDGSWDPDRDVQIVH